MQNWVNVTYQQVVFGHGQCIVLADAQFQCQAVGVVLSKHESVVDKLEARKAGSGICSGLNPKLLSPFSQQQAQASQFLSIHFFIKSNGRFARKMATDVIKKKLTWLAAISPPQQFSDPNVVGFKNHQGNKHELTQLSMTSFNGMS